MSVSPRRPWICAQPVQPGRTCCRTRYRGISSLKCSTWKGTSGRGPTRDMSPFSTLKNWGSSSRLNLRIRLPNRVLRGVVVGGPAGLLLGVHTRMERNLYIMKGFLFSPHPLLPEDHRPGAGQLDADGRDQHHGAGQHNENQAAHNVQSALDGGVEDIVKGGLPHVDEFALVQHVDGGTGPADNHCKRAPW